MVVHLNMVDQLVHQVRISQFIGIVGNGLLQLLLPPQASNRNGNHLCEQLLGLLGKLEGLVQVL